MYGIAQTQTLQAEGNLTRVVLSQTLSATGLTVGQLKYVALWFPEDLPYPGNPSESTPATNLLHRIFQEQGDDLSAYSVMYSASNVSSSDSLESVVVAVPSTLPQNRMYYEHEAL